MHVYAQFVKVTFTVNILCFVMNYILFRPCTPSLHQALNLIATSYLCHHRVMHACGRTEKAREIVPIACLAFEWMVASVPIVYAVSYCLCVRCVIGSLRGADGGCGGPHAVCLVEDGGGKRYLCCVVSLMIIVTAEIRLPRTNIVKVWSFHNSCTILLNVFYLTLEFHCYFLVLIFRTRELYF